MYDSAVYEKTAKGKDVVQTTLGNIGLFPKTNCPSTGDMRFSGTRNANSVMLTTTWTPLWSRENVSEARRLLKGTRWQEHKWKPGQTGSRARDPAIFNHL